MYRERERERECAHAHMFTLGNSLRVMYGKLQRRELRLISSYC